MFVGLYTAFLLLGMYHGIQGMWNIIRDFKLKPAISLTLYGILVVMALIFLGIGLNTLFTFNPAKA
jgi:succinate dehydrogenase hydrophobic anchor subunit